MGALLAASAAGAGPSRVADLRRLGRCRPPNWVRNAAALVVELHSELGMPLGEGRPRFCGPNSDCTLQRAVWCNCSPYRRRGGTDEMRRWREQIRCSPVATPDETGWRVKLANHLSVGRSPPRKPRSTPSASAEGFRRCGGVLGATRRIDATNWRAEQAIRSRSHHPQGLRQQPHPAWRRHPRRCWLGVVCTAAPPPT